MTASDQHLYRLTRAQGLVEGVTHTSRNRWKVQSEHTPRVWQVKKLQTPVPYRTNPTGLLHFSCSCPDHANGFKCKHIMAVEIFSARQEEVSPENIARVMNDLQSIKSALE